MTTTAVIPVKQLENAKQRLSGFLTADERRQLFSAMVEDVLTAVEACVLIDNFIVVTDDEDVADLARSFGAEIRPEPESPGLIESVTASAKQLAAEGVEVMLFLPGDVPLVTAEELEVLLEGFGRADTPEFLIVPASDLGGSNCVACAPPDCMSFGFGVDSFRRHLDIARDLGLTPTVAKLPGIGLDIDTPEDLAALVDLVMGDARDAREYSTVRFLATSGILEKIDIDAQNLARQERESDMNKADSGS
jgi:2-phospho-L-lactate guanylyltransferase